MLNESKEKETELAPITVEHENTLSLDVVSGFSSDTSDTDTNDYIAHTKLESTITLSISTCEDSFEDSFEDYCYNDIVCLKNGLIGTIKFIGTIAMQSCVWYGIDLNEPKGKHNGTLKGRTYWLSKENHGIFVKKHQISRIEKRRNGERFSINTIVKVRKKGKAWIRFIGHLPIIIPTENSTTDIIRQPMDILIYGIELMSSMGQNSGYLKEYYFTCPHFRGLFVEENELIYRAMNAPPTPRMSRSQRHKNRESEQRRSRKHMKIVSQLMMTERIDFEDEEKANTNEKFIDEDDDGITEESDLDSSSSEFEVFLDESQHKKLSLLVSGDLETERMSFARILNMFQKNNSRHIIAGYNHNSHSIRNLNTGNINSLVMEAKQVIKDEQRKRGYSNVNNCSSYKPPTFTDMAVNASQFRRRPRRLKVKIPSTNIVSHKSLTNKSLTKVSEIRLSAHAASNSLPTTPTLFASEHSTDTKVSTPTASVTTLKFGHQKMKGRGRPRVKSRGIRRKVSNISELEETPVDLCSWTSSISSYVNPDDDNKQTTDSTVVITKVKSVSDIVISQSNPVSPYPPKTIDFFNNVNKNKTDSKEDEYSGLGFISPAGAGVLPSLSLTTSVSITADDDQTPNAVIDNRNTSPTAAEVYSWIFKPAEKEEKQVKFKLKAKPDSPFDVSSTVREFSKVAEVLMLGCNNPKNLFKVLKGVCAKLKLSNPKYRKIDIMNTAVHKKLLRFNGTEDFLILLGFCRNPKTSVWTCAMDQPPLTVLENALQVCNECILQCNQKRAAIDMIKKFSSSQNRLKTVVRKKRRRKKKRMGNSPKLVVLDVSNSMVSVFPSELEKQMSISDTNIDSPSISPRSYLAPTRTMQRSPSIRIEDATATINESQFEEDLEGSSDTFQLTEIIWSVTHAENSDKSVQNIILLTYPTFTDSITLFKLLVERFFGNDNKARECSISQSHSESIQSFDTDNSTHIPHFSQSVSNKYEYSEQSNTAVSNKYEFGDTSHVESQWEVQVKVISFIQHWMREFWIEDWWENEEMFDCCEEFCAKLKIAYTSDPNMSTVDIAKGMKLAAMLNQSMDFQEVNHMKKERRTRARTQTIPGSKLFEAFGLDSEIAKVKEGFIKVSNEIIAQQITTMDFEFFSAIEKRECLGQAWKKKDKHTRAKHVCELISQFNSISKWCQLTILYTSTVKKRGRMIKKFIKISNELFKLRNFQSLCALHGALSSVPIRRLKHAWNFVPAKHITRFEEMRVIFTTNRNMQNLRKLHREASAPLVPYTGIFLSDLVSIEESQAKRKNDGTVNFSKLMRLCNAIENVLVYQRTTYSFPENPVIRRYLLAEFEKNENFDSDAIYHYSTSIVESDIPKGRQSLFQRSNSIRAKSYAGFTRIR